MRSLILALALAVVVAAPAAAQSPISAEIGATGIAATRNRLAGIAAPTDAERFALGGLHFLQVVETTLQERWRVDLGEDRLPFPLLRLPVPENPAPAPFTADFVAGFFGKVAADMAGVHAALADLPEDSDFGLEIALADIWFDINADGQREAGEGLAEIAGFAMFGGIGADPGLPPMVVRFDVADAAWLSAYAHFLAGFSEVVLAYDPTESIEGVFAAKAGLAALDTPMDPGNAMDMQFGQFIDAFAALRGALDQEPDHARAAAAHAHFLAMLDDNRRFWRLVATESDNALEWIPNDAQQSALGFQLPPGTGASWQGVLADGEALLKGEKLIPYWRLDQGAGLNLGKMFLEPRRIDIVDWVQGAAALPYAEIGPRVSPENWQRFDALMEGGGMLMVFVLN